MTRLRDTPLNLTRRGVLRPPRRRFRAVLAVLVVLSMGLLVLDRLKHPVLRDLRWHVSAWLTPVLTAAAQPLEPVRWARRQLAALSATSAEINRLRSENRRLAAATSRVLALERQMAELATLARVVPEHAVPFVSARVVATSSGVFVRTVTINAGRDDGVRAGYPVVSGDGLIGRVLEAGAGSARVMLLTDLSSRVPAVVGTAAVRAVLVGDNGALPRLDFIAATSGSAEGDEVVTSGVGGVYPRGLRIGRVVRGGRTLRVAPYAALDDLEFVAVLRHDTPLGDLDDGASSSAVGAASRALVGARAPSPPEAAP